MHGCETNEREAECPAFEMNAHEKLRSLEVTAPTSGNKRLIKPVYFTRRRKSNNEPPANTASMVGSGTLLTT